MQFIFEFFAFLSDKIEKTEIKIVKRSVTKTKAFYLQRVGSNDGSPTRSMKFRCLVRALQYLEKHLHKKEAAMRGT